jgi:Lipocalin-like domain
MAQDTVTKPLSRDLTLASWKMTSWVTRDVMTGERGDALGQNPRGMVMYTPERVVFLITKGNRKRPERLPPSDEEKIPLFDTLFAYSGSYTVESDRIIHHVDLSWNEAWNVTDQVRFCVVD